MPTSVDDGGHDFSVDAREFWQGIHNGMDPSELYAIQERMKEHCPSVDVFSFEAVDDDPTISLDPPLELLRRILQNPVWMHGIQPS